MLLTLLRNKYFLIFLQFKTTFMVSAALHNITIVYITTLTYWSDNFDLKSTHYEEILQNDQFEMI